MEMVQRLRVLFFLFNLGNDEGIIVMVPDLFKEILEVSRNCTSKCQHLIKKVLHFVSRQHIKFIANKQFKQFKVLT